MLNPVKSEVQDTPQLSVATAPPRVVTQLSNAAVLPAPSHSTVRLAAGVVIIGNSLSCKSTPTVITVSFGGVPVGLGGLGVLSLNLTCTVGFVPKSAQVNVLAAALPKIIIRLFPIVIQLSVPVTIASAAFIPKVIEPVASKTAGIIVPGGVVSTGGSVSVTITSKLQVADNPALSTTTKVLVVVPTGNNVPLA